MQEFDAKDFARIVLKRNRLEVFSKAIVCNNILLDSIVVRFGEQNAIVAVIAEIVSNDFVVLTAGDFKTKPVVNNYIASNEIV